MRWPMVTQTVWVKTIPERPSSLICLDQTKAVLEYQRRLFLTAIIANGQGCRSDGNTGRVESGLSGDVWR